MTGTPINRRDHNTFWAFGAQVDDRGYLSRYSFQDSIRDKATLPLHFDVAEVELRIDKSAIDEAYAQLTGHLSDQDRDDLAKRAAKMAVLVKAPERVQGIVESMVNHYQTKVEPNGFKAMVVTFDRECCVLYKQAMDELLPADASAIAMSTQQTDPDAWAEHDRSKDEEEQLLDRYRDPSDPLSILIVTAKLLTGFDAPILQAMYLDKPMRDHTLLQAICRTNRPYPEKTHGLIVDYLGIFDDVAQALDFDDKAVVQVISNLAELRRKLPELVQKCLGFFPDVDRSVGGYEGLIAAQECLPNNVTRDAFAAQYSVLSRVWEALSPDPCLSAYEDDYRWLTRAYESVKPLSGNGKLLWHTLGAKTISLIHEHTHLDGKISDDLETLVMDADVLEGLLESKESGKKAKEVEIRLVARLRRHAGDPKFKALGERLEELRRRHEAGLDASKEFLKQLLQLAKDVLAAEEETDPEEDRSQAKAALTELFEEVRTDKTPVLVERIVADIDEIVRVMRFPDWQQTTAGEREVKKALRGTLRKYQLHRDQELFDRAYGYVKQYY